MLLILRSAVGPPIGRERYDRAVAGPSEPTARRNRASRCLIVGLKARTLPYCRKRFAGFAVRASFAGADRASSGRRSSFALTDRERSPIERAVVRPSFHGHRESFVEIARGKRSEISLKLKTGQIIEHTNALARRPELAALIGIIVSEWSIAEMVMATLFSVLLKVDFPIATALMDIATNFAHKRNMVMIVAEARVKDPSLKSTLKDTLHKVQEIGDRRSKLVHGKWSTCEDLPDTLLWQAKTWAADGFIPYKAQDLSKVITEIIERRASLQLLIPEVAKHLGLLDA
jgi:hypothetical protein